MWPTGKRNAEWILVAMTAFDCLSDVLLHIFNNTGIDSYKDSYKDMDHHFFRARATWKRAGSMLWHTYGSSCSLQQGKRAKKIIKTKGRVSKTLYKKHYIQSLNLNQRGLFGWNQSEDHHCFLERAVHKKHTQTHTQQDPMWGRYWM